MDRYPSLDKSGASSNQPMRCAQQMVEREVRRTVLLAIVASVPHRTRIAPERGCNCVTRGSMIGLAGHAFLVCRATEGRGAT